MCSYEVWGSTEQGELYSKIPPKSFFHKFAVGESVHFMWAQNSLRKSQQYISNSFSRVVGSLVFRTGGIGNAASRGVNLTHVRKPCRGPRGNPQNT